MEGLGLKHLFRPLTVRGLTLANRLVMPPMGTRYPSYGGAVTPRLIAYYAARARGGTGLIIVQFAAVSPDGVSSLYPLAIWDDRFVPGLRELTEAIHQAGGRAAIQLAHAGGTTSSAFTRRPVVAPSAVPALGRETPRALTQEQIAAVREDFAGAARRAVDAGFDAIELHMSHGYLLNQFLSPLFNQRGDRYGGSVEGRARFPLEVLRRVRQVAGEEIAVLCRLSADDGVPGSLGLSEACEIATMLETNGADIIDVTAGIGESFELSVPAMSHPAGRLVPYAAAIKRVVTVPVIAVGKLHDPRLAEEILAKGQADLIAIGRGLIADPEWANKAAEGRYEEIRPCLTCNRPECHGRILRQVEMGCVVNASVGREALFPLLPAERPKRALIIGGGPAGLEAARVAAIRGHQVVLCDENPGLGGQMLLASKPPHKSDLDKLVAYYGREMALRGVEVRLNCQATPEWVAEQAPEAVILASGADPWIPPIPGVEAAITAWDVLAGKAVPGESIVIVGAGDVGCETAEFLAAEGRRVTIIEMLDQVAPEMAAWTRRMLIERLLALDVEIILQAKVTGIEARRVVYDREGVMGEIRPVDQVVLASGAVSKAALYEGLAGCGCPVYIIGDARRPSNLADAIRQGFEAGYSL